MVPFGVKWISVSWHWMRKVVDYVLGEFEIDGFHLESADQGRCLCPSCSHLGDVEYHCTLNRRTAEHVRSRWPGKTLMVNMCGFMRPQRKATDDELPFLLDLGRHIDFLIDPGHHGCFIPDQWRREFCSQLACAFGTSGGTWVYPPQGWDRLRWFLPHPTQICEYYRALYEQGARASESYLGPVINPGVEINLAVCGLAQCDVDRDGRQILSEVVASLYRPADAAVLEQLVELFLRAERAYFDHWTPVPPPPSDWIGEIHLKPLAGETLGPVSYLSDNCWGGVLMDAGGRAAYRRRVLDILDEIPTIRGKLDDDGRLGRIETCLRNVLTDIESFEST